MQEFPHTYHAVADAVPDGDIPLTANGLPTLRTASPAQFGGPGDRWSPETLLTGAVADCFVLTFRAIARASKLPWASLRCEVSGTLDRVDRTTQFTVFDLVACLDVPDGVNHELALKALDKAERTCLITSSLKGAVQLHPTVRTQEAAPLVAGD